MPGEMGPRCPNSTNQSGGAAHEYEASTVSSNKIFLFYKVSFLRDFPRHPFKKACKKGPPKKENLIGTDRKEKPQKINVLTPGKEKLRSRAAEKVAVTLAGVGRNSRGELPAWPGTCARTAEFFFNFLRAHR